MFNQVFPVLVWVTLMINPGSPQNSETTVESPMPLVFQKPERVLDPEKPDGLRHFISTIEFYQEEDPYSVSYLVGFDCSSFDVIEDIVVSASQEEGPPLTKETFEGLCKLGFYVLRDNTIARHSIEDVLRIIAPFTDEEKNAIKAGFERYLDSRD